uniref:hypothetical protein n=1 Tax=Candidatus Stercorousia sp. TaxID=3048886 RepID=UPI004027E29E
RGFCKPFNWLNKNKEEQCETQIINDKKRLKDATNIAQQIFYITDNYVKYFLCDEQKKYKNLRKKFDKKD